MKTFVIYIPGALPIEVEGENLSWENGRLCIMGGRFYIIAVISPEATVIEKEIIKE